MNTLITIPYGVKIYIRNGSTDFIQALQHADLVKEEGYGKNRKLIEVTSIDEKIDIELLPGFVRIHEENDAALKDDRIKKAESEKDVWLKYSQEKEKELNELKAKLINQATEPQQ